MGDIPDAASHEALDRDDGIARIARLLSLRFVADVRRAVRQKRTTEGNSGRPSSSLNTTARPLLTVATRELVVPRSIPTASLC